MKCLRKDLIEEKHQQAYAMSERRILGKVACPYIVQLKCAFQTLDKLYMVMEFVNGGELFVHLRKASHFSEPRARLYAAELLLALEHLHSQGIIYRDLKPENVLLDLEGHVKLTDFGLSKVLGRKQAFSFCGTPEYIAPEILLGKGYDYSVDFWSFGCLVYEMLSGVPPFYSRNPELVMQNILNKPVEMKPHFSMGACDLLFGLLQVEPKKRLKSFSEIKNSAFFDDTDWTLVANQQIEPEFKPEVHNQRDMKYFEKMYTQCPEEEEETPASFCMKYDGFTFNNSVL